MNNKNKILLGILTGVIIVAVVLYVLIAKSAPGANRQANTDINTSTQVANDNENNNVEEGLLENEVEGDDDVTKDDANLVTNETANMQYTTDDVEGSSVNGQEENNVNVPEITGILNPSIEFKAFDVEPASTNTEEQTASLAFTKPTYILFVDLTQEESVQMLNLINNLKGKYVDKVDFALISNLTASKEQVEEYLTTYGINIPVFFDNGGEKSPSTQYGINAYPYTLIVDKAGNIVNNFQGLKEEDTVVANLDIITENFE